MGAGKREMLRNKGAITATLSTLTTLDAFTQPDGLKGHYPASFPALQAKIEELKKLVDSYCPDSDLGSLDDTPPIIAEQQQKLTDMLKCIDRIDDLLIGSGLAPPDDYHLSIKGQLREAIKQELSEITPGVSVSGHKPGTLAALLDNMDEVHAVKFVQALQSKDVHSIAQIYQITEIDEISPTTKKAFDDFWRSHKIKLLGQINEGELQFEITNGQASQFLSIASAAGTAPVGCIDTSPQEAPTFKRIIGNVCLAVTSEAPRKKEFEPNPKYAADVAAVFLKLLNANVAPPKIVSAGSQLELYFADELSMQAYTQASNDFNPLAKDLKIETSALGQAIHDYLTGNTPAALDFSHDIFNSPIGKEYQQLIQGLTNVNQAQRMPNANSLAHLHLIKIMTAVADETVVAAVSLLFHQAFDDTSKDCNDLSKDLFLRLENNITNDEFKSQCQKLLTSFAAIKSLDRNSREAHGFIQRQSLAFLNAPDHNTREQIVKNTQRYALSLQLGLKVTEANEVTVEQYQAASGKLTTALQELQQTLRPTKPTTDSDDSDHVLVISCISDQPVEQPAERDLFLNCGLACDKEFKANHQDPEMGQQTAARIVALTEAISELSEKIKTTFKEPCFVIDFKAPLLTAISKNLTAFFEHSLAQNMVPTVEAVEVIGYRLQAAQLINKYIWKDCNNDKKRKPIVDIIKALEPEQQADLLRDDVLKKLYPALRAAHSPGCMRFFKDPFKQLQKSLQELKAARGLEYHAEMGGPSLDEAAPSTVSPTGRR